MSKTSSKTTKTAPAAPKAKAAASPSTKTASKKTTAPKVEVAPATPATPAAPVAENVVEAVTAPALDVESVISNKFSDFSDKLQEFASLHSSIKGEFKLLEKIVKRELKSLVKSSLKRRRSGNKKPSGFVKPTPLSDELCAFLDQPSGTEMARTAVTKEINKYIQANELKDKSNGRIILPDAKLTKLLKIGPNDDQLTYFNLQKYMSHHFPKQPKPVVASA